MKYLIEYDKKINCYSIYNIKDKKELYEPVCIKRISGEAMDEIIDLFLFGVIGRDKEENK